MGSESNEIDHLIYVAVFNDNWGLVSKIFQDLPEPQTKTINLRLETPLMIAVGTNQSHDFVKKLLSSLATDDDSISRALAAVNSEGDTALHYAAKIGNMIDAKLLISSSSNPAEMVLRKNKKKSTALNCAALLGRKTEMLEYFYSVMGVLRPSGLESPTRNFSANDLITPAIDAGFLDLALKLVDSYSNGVISGSLQATLNELAKKTELFPSGSELGIRRRCIYKLLPVYTSELSVYTNKVISDEKTPSQQLAHDEEANYIPKKCSSCKSTPTTAWFFKRILLNLASPIKNMYDLKLTHKQAIHLVNRICKIVTEKRNQDTIWTILGSTMVTAVKYGNYEVLRECLSAYPSVIWSAFGELRLFHDVIKERREQVYNLVYGMISYKGLVLSEFDVDKKEDNILHIAAKLAPSHRLITVTGAALQMQRELQWFEEIESFVEPSLKKAENQDGKTPRIVFKDEHKELLKQGKEWMKDTASSSTVVAALVVTVAFAAVFTLPGGEENKGKIAFTIFIISDATALFSSAISALLFLGILTSRYAEKDFLHVLPRILMSGLFTLFLSLAATMITFSATLALVLQEEMTWLAAPLVIITSIPVGLFVLIQFPLLIELFCSTYGPSIFTK